MSATALTVKCDRYDECAQRLADACERLECPFRDSHPRLDDAVAELRRREDAQDRVMEALRATVASVDKRLEHIDGSIQGALAASRMGGAIVGALASAGVAIGIAVFGRR